MPFLEFVGQSRKDAAFAQADTSRLVNCYREPIEGGYQIRADLGTVALANLSAVFMRAMEEVSGDIYAVCGGGLYRVEKFGTATRLGNVTDGEATISGNNGQIAIASGGTYYVWTGSAMTQPVGGAFSAVGSVDFVGQQTVMTELGGRRFQWSDPAAPETLNALSFATAEGRDDNILRGIVINGNVWLMKEKSCEVWYPTATGFERISGGVIEKGLRAFGLVSRCDGGAFFVGNDGIVYLTDGAGLRPVSTGGVETDIQIGQARRCFYYEDEGHKFCVVQFSDRPAWKYDISTGEWSNRASGTEHAPWRVVASAKAWGYWHVGGDIGQVLRLDRTGEDHDGPLVRTAVSRTLSSGDYATLAMVELFGRTGEAEVGGELTTILGGVNYFLQDVSGAALLVGTQALPTREPAVTLRLSTDGGRTWGKSRARTFGALGQYQKRAVWRALGRNRRWTAEVTMSDAVDTPIEARVRLEVA